MGSFLGWTRAGHYSGSSILGPSLIQMGRFIHRFRAIIYASTKLTPSRGLLITLNFETVYFNRLSWDNTQY